MPHDIALITEQLRRPTPGGIGTYTTGLLQGLGELADPSISVREWQSPLPVALRTRLWDRGIGRIKADLVHAPSLAFPAPRGRLVVVVHDLTWRDAAETFAPSARAWHERAFRRALAQADVLVVPSRLTADRVVAAGADAGRVKVIDEGSDHLPPPDHAGAERLVTGPFILSVGTRERRKNLGRLLAAYEQARPAFTEDMTLVITGPEGWLDVGRLDGAIVTGRVDAAVLAALYARARVFAYVPLVEGFGLPPVEAMRAGAPVVASNEVPSVGDAGLIVDPFDVDAIAEGLVRVANDESLRADLTRRGITRSDELTWKNTARSHVELWNSLL